GFGAQAEGDGRVGVRVAEGFGKQPIHGGKLVLRRDHQLPVDVAEAGRRLAAREQRVQRVEASLHRKPQLSARRSLRIDIVEMRKILRVFQFANRGDAMPPVMLLPGHPLSRQCRRQKYQRQNERSQAASQHAISFSLVVASEHKAKSGKKQAPRLTTVLPCRRLTAISVSPKSSFTVDSVRK